MSIRMYRKIKRKIVRIYLHLYLYYIIEISKSIFNA